MYLLGGVTMTEPDNCVNGWTNSVNRWPSRRLASSAATRSTCTPTMREPPSRRAWRSVTPDGSRSRCDSGTGGLPPGGWTRERAVLAVIDGDGRSGVVHRRMCLGAAARPPRRGADNGDHRAAAAACRRRYRRRSGDGVAQSATCPPKSWSPGPAPRQSGGASMWCRCPAARWCRDWPGARGARTGPASRRRRLHDGPGGGQRPARSGARRHRERR